MITQQLTRLQPLRACSQAFVSAALIAATLVSPALAATIAVGPGASICGSCLRNRPIPTGS